MQIQIEAVSFFESNNEPVITARLLPHSCYFLAVNAISINRKVVFI